MFNICFWNSIGKWSWERERETQTVIPIIKSPVRMMLQINALHAIQIAFNSDIFYGLYLHTWFIQLWNRNEKSWIDGVYNFCESISNTNEKFQYEFQRVELNTSKKEVGFEEKGASSICIIFYIYCWHFSNIAQCAHVITHSRSFFHSSIRFASLCHFPINGCSDQPNSFWIFLFTKRCGALNRYFSIEMQWI